MSSDSDEAVLHPVPGWGGKLGLTSLSGPDSWSKIPGATIAEIQQCINRYCWGFDDRRLDILSDCFLEGGIWEASVMGEVKIGPFLGRPQVLEWLARFWNHQQDQRRHVFTNLIVDEVNGNTAVAYSYLLLLGSSSSMTQLESVGFYRFSLERRDDRWFIAELLAGFDSPFWKIPVSEMSPRVRDLFGITAF